MSLEFGDEIKFNSMYDKSVSGAPKGLGAWFLEKWVVMLIVGLLIVIFFVFIKKSDDKDGMKIQAMTTTRNALQMYATDKGGFPASINSLVPDYIGTIDQNLLYVGRNNNGTVCSSDTCVSYHLAVPLDSVDNKILSTDSNGVTVGAIDGETSNCLPDGTYINLCYDIIP